MGAESLGQLRGRVGSQGGFNMPGREAGLLANTESWSAISWCRSPGHRGIKRRSVGCCRSGLPMKSLGNRCRRILSGWR